jgi:hypothetical protein
VCAHADDAEDEVPPGNPWIALAVGSAVIAIGGGATWYVATQRVQDAEREAQERANSGMNHDDVDAEGRGSRISVRR